MNKSDLISAMAAEAQMSKADAKKALDAFITSVTNAMKAGDKVSLVGFGTFSVSERAERTGINPSTKATITIPAKKVAKFKAGDEEHRGLHHGPEQLRGAYTRRSGPDKLHAAS